MTQTTSPTTPQTVSASGKPLPVLPDEKFWKKYSPHHEFPLSGVTSVVIHGLAIALLVLVSYYAAKQANAAMRPPKASVLPTDDLPDIYRPDELPPQFGGGGGSTDGVGPGSNTGLDETAGNDKPGPDRGAIKVDRPDLPDGPGPSGQIKLPSWEGNPVVRELVQSGNETAESVDRLNRNMLDKLRQGLRKGEGQGGSGQGGGQGEGSGPDKGSGDGAGKGVSKREQRVLRWTMVFSTLNGDDYAKQLHSLGAYVAIPDPDDGTQFRVIRNLSKRPVEGKVEDLSEIKRIFWVDDKKDSVHRLAAALRLSPVPDRVVAFFPEELERKLLKLELDFMGRKEEQIAETRFEVIKVGPNRYEPRVVSQKQRK